MHQPDLYLGDDQTKQTFRFFLPLYVTQDRKGLFTPLMRYPERLQINSRLIIKSHKEKCFNTGRFTRKYRLFIDESKSDPL